MNSVYEFENGSIYDTGDNVTSAVSLSGASRGMAVDLKDSGDSVTLNVNAEKSGMQTLTIRYSQPYDENGKYQNVIVNGQNVGQIFCAYTGEGQFRTVSISANLTAGSNTVAIEGSWGWTYLDSLTIGDASVGKGSNPIISRNVSSYSGNQSSASSGNDDKYYTFWTSSPDDYLAYDLSAVPEEQRKKVIAVWYNTSTYDNIGVYVNKDAEPVDYTIEVNKAAGGAYPGDDYVDIIGEDSYAGERNYGAQNAKFSELLEYSDSNKIIALTENGTVFDIDKVVAANSLWAWFGIWCGDFVVKDGHYSETFTEKEIMKKTYNSEYVITLDELDWNK